MLHLNKEVSSKFYIFYRPVDFLETLNAIRILFGLRTEYCVKPQRHNRTTLVTLSVCSMNISGNDQGQINIKMAEQLSVTSKHYS